MKFKEIVARITGISTPIFGVSWQPEKTECAIAKEVIAYLEDRRVLFNPYELEVPDYCITSVLQMREFLTGHIVHLDPKTELCSSLKAMRAACRKFLNTVQREFGNRVRPMFGSMVDNWLFLTALGELRGVIGIQIAKLAVQHGLDVEDELASILPALDRDDDVPERKPARPR